MARHDNPSASSSNGNNVDSNNNIQTKEWSSSKEVNNTILATKYHNNKPNELVLLQFSDAMMQAMGLKKKNKSPTNK